MTAQRKRKIIGIISFMNAAGAQEALLRVGRQMRARGHDMEVWFLYQEDTIFESEPCIRVFRRKSNLSAIEYVGVFFEIVRELRNARPDTVVGFLPLGNVFGLVAAFMAGVQWRIASQRAPGYSFGKVMRICDRVLGSIGIYNKIVCVSNSVKESFSRYPSKYKERLSVIHNGIEWKEMELDKMECRRALGLPETQFLFAAIGRMKTQKNYTYLLRSFAAMKLNAVVAIAGDGLLRKSLEDLCEALGISDRVVFLGTLDRADIRKLLSAADAFIQLSHYEGQSNAVLEAMHQGLPMILSDIPEQRETVVVGGEISAVLVELDDVAKVGSAMDQLTSNEAYCELLGTTAQSIVSQNFSVNRMADNFEEILVRKVSGPPKLSQEK